MTTSVKITNHGPGKIRVRERDISLSARGTDKDAYETVLLPGETKDYVTLWGTRKIVIEEVDETIDTGLGRR